MTRVSINAVINDDRVFEISESFLLAIVQASFPAGVSRGNPGQVTIIISDDDGEFYSVIRLLLPC